MTIFALMKEKQNIRRIPAAELEKFLLEKGEKKFRIEQLNEWLWQKNAGSFGEMTNLSIKTRQLLDDHFYISRIRVSQSQKSRDGTVKVAFQLEDDKIIEGVLIPSHERMTACISSQVGCNLGCEFCATAKIGFQRNLYADEILDQVVEIDRLARENYDIGLSNIVFMGMGEPLMNYAHVVQSIKLMSSEKGAGYSPKRITLSTVGLPGQIIKLADEDLKINLALSLHVANDDKRSQIVPVNKQNPINKLIEAVKYYHEKTGTRITIEYILFKDFNDSIEEARDLADFCKHFPVKVNVIEYNPVQGSYMQPPGRESTDEFVKFLKEKINIIVNVRRSRGKDIDAACGQLANKLKH